MATVLLVEDHDDTREMYSLSLEVEGFVVVAVPSATEALSSLAGVTPDIIVTDLSMPGMDGVEFCRRIRALPSFRTVPLLAVTGHSSDTARTLTSEAGACAICPKPIAGTDLAAAVRTLLAERSVCKRCWETGAPFQWVSFGDRVFGWMRHEPIEPDA